MTLTKEDTRFLLEIGVATESATGPLEFTQAEWRYLTAQLRQDLDAAMTDVRRVEQLNACLVHQCHALEDEANAVRRRVREFEEGGWWKRIWSRVKVMV